MINFCRMFPIASVVFFFLFFAPVAWSGENSTPDKITITYVKLPLNVPIIIAKHLELFEKEFGKDNIVVEWADITAGPKQIQAMAAGSVQFASAISADSVITARANGMDIKVIGAFARAPRAFNVMSIDPNITTVQDLKGKIVAGPKGSLLNQLLFAALIDAGLKPRDVQFVSMPGGQALTAMLSGNVDAALVAGPGAVRALAEGASVIANGEGLVRGIILIAVDGKFLREYPEITERYLMVHNQALQYMIDNPEETYRIAAEETGISEADVKRIFPDYDYNHIISDIDIADLIATREFLMQYGMMLTSVEIEELIYQ